MANQWLRLWHDMPNDPKWRTIARISGQSIPVVLSVYLHLLVDGSRNVTRGHVTVTLEDIASAIDVSEDAISSVLDAMQGRVLDEKRLTGWELRQPKKEDAGDAETGAKSAAERKREQRERDKAEAESKQQSKPVTESHEESRNVTLDKEEDKDKENKKQKQKKGAALPLDFSVPEFISSRTWRSWVTHRIEIKKPMTESIAKACIAQLTKFHQAGHDVDEIILNSISGGWSGLFEPNAKRGTGPPAKKPPSGTMQTLERLERLKNGLDDKRDINGPAKIALLESGQNTGSGFN